MTITETQETTESQPTLIEFPLHPLISRRRSTRAFSAKPVETAKLRSVLEAARWAPSSNNIQPWRFIVATSDDQAGHRRMTELLTGWNQAWAGTAPVLMLSVAQVEEEGGRRNRFAFHDTALATANLTLQATALGLAVHQMGGFDTEKARAAFEIPAGYEPVVMIALGYEGSVDSLPPQLAARETAPRKRKRLPEFVFGASFNEPAHLGGDELQKSFNQIPNN